MKKMVSMIVALAFMACFFVGCTSTSQPEASAAPASDAAETATADTVEDAVAEVVENVATDGEPILIGCPLSNFADKSISYLRAGLETYAATRDDVELIVQDSKWDANTQIALVENMIAVGCKAIIMNPVESTACQPIVNACAESGVYLICISKRMSDELQEKAYFIGPNMVQSGEAQGEGVLKALGETGKVAYLYGKMGTENMLKRTEGAKNILEQYDGIEMVAENTANWKREEAITVVENWIQSGVEFDAIVANNDEMAIGAALALQSQGLDVNNYVIAGIDGTPDSLDFMKQGLLTVTAYDSWETMYTGAINMAVDLVEGKEVQRENFILTETVMQDQADEYLEKWQPLLDAVAKLGE